MKENPDEKEELAERLGRDTHPKKTSSTNGVCSEMLNSIHQGQSSQPDSTQPTFPQANPDQREELARRPVEINAVSSQMINTRHQGQSSQSDSTQAFFPQENPDEMWFGRNPQPEQMVIPMDETFNTGALLEYKKDGLKETNAVVSEMINTSHQGQFSQPDSTQSSFPQRGMHVLMDYPIFTPSQVNFDHLNYHDMHASQDGATVNPSMAASSMDIEGQQQLQPGEEGNIWNNLGDTENTSSRAVISNVCGEDRSDVPDLGSAGREGGASPDVRMRMQNAVSLARGSKKRKCAPGSGTRATALQLDDSEQSSPISVSNFISSPPETPDASMPVPRETCTPPSHGQKRACVPNRTNGVAQGTNVVGSELLNNMRQPARTVIPMDETYSIGAVLEDNNDGVQENGIGRNTFGAGSCQPQTSSDTQVANAGVQAPQEEGRENGRGCNTFGAGSSQPRTPTRSTQLRFDTVQLINEQDVSRAPLTNLNEIEAMLNEAVKEHLRITLSSSAEQQQYHESTPSCENQLRTDLEPPASDPQVRSSMQTSGNCNLFDPGSSQGTEDFASLAERFRELSQQEVDTRRKLVQNMLYLVRRLKGLTSKQADLKTQLEEKESFTVKKRKQEVHNWLERVDKVKEEVVDEINRTSHEIFLNFRGPDVRPFPIGDLRRAKFSFVNQRQVILKRRPSLEDVEHEILEGRFSLEDLQQKISKGRLYLKNLERKNNRIEELITEVGELLEEGKLLLDLTVDVVLQRKVVNRRSQLQHFIDQHFNDLILVMT